MRESRFLVSLMVLAIAAVDLATLAHAGPLDDPLLAGWPTPELVVVFSLAFSQVSLVSVWAGLGAAWVPWRVASVALVVTLWSIALTMSARGFIPGYNKNVWTLHLASQAALILTVTLLMRWRGRRLVNRNRPTDTKGNEEQAGRPRFQFSLSYLIAWMTALAITVGMLQYTVDFESLPSAHCDWYGILVNNVIAAVTLLATMLLTVDSRPRVEQVGDLGFVTLLAVTLLLLCSQANDAGDQDRFIAFAGLFLLETVWLAVAFGVLRVAGLRVTTGQTAGRTSR